MIRTAEGARSGEFGPTDWALLLITAAIWGSSFLWIAIGLDSLEPGVVAWARLILGVAMLASLPSARRRISREDWGAVAIVGIAGNAAPALLFAWAEQTLESSVAGMITSSVPLFTLLIAYALGVRAFRRIHAAGLATGFTGVVLLSLPNVSGTGAAPAGVAMVFLAVLGYSLTSNVLVPLQQKYGGFAVILWAQALGVIVTAPFGIAGLGDSEFEWGPVIAVVALGVFGTGLARSLQATVIGRVGAPRASIVGYLVPVVAVVLGILVRDESIGPLEVGGLGLILAGAFLVSRAVSRRT